LFIERLSLAAKVHQVDGVEKAGQLFFECHAQV
jgi:hypothetical protein